jgi:hypothetical protein
MISPRSGPVRILAIHGGSVLWVEEKVEERAVCSYL